MVFIRFKKDNSIYAGVLEKENNLAVSLEAFGEEYKGEELLLEKLTDCAVAKIKEALKSGNYKKECAFSADEVELLAPISRPIHDVICVGVNYYDHLEETKGFDNSVVGKKKTVYFSKRATEFTGPNASLESMSEVDPSLDYEVELAVIIGKKGRNIKREEAEEYIFGYSVFNDVSARTLQKEHVQWYRGKSLDGFSCLGPWIVHRSDLPLPFALNVTSRVNGETRQNSNTSLMMNDILGIIEDFSNGITLEPGDVIATGTPSGVGMGFDPPRYMKKGDTVEVEVEKVGVLKNYIK